MINNHYVAIPGYVFPDGIRQCVNQLSQFSSSDAVLIKSLSKRLETYCSRIENILFNGKNHSFNDALSYKNQIKLIKGYANFLKEFYASAAPRTFYYASQTHPLMQRVMPSIKWDQYDTGNSKNSLKKTERNNAASINGNLGKVYRALHQGDSQQAYAIGQECVKTVVQGKEIITSVFERYPALHQKVEVQYHADKAKAEQIRIAKEAALKQEAAQAQAQYQKQSNELCLQKRSDVLQDRCAAAITQYYDPKVFPQLHTLLAEQAKCINAQHLTADQKGILFEGGHLQHYLVDEAISVTDAVISGDLIESMHDAVLDLTNTSISLNKEGNVLTASRALDACWALVDHAQAAAHYAYTVARTHAPLVAKGVADGVCESLHGAAHVVCHPVEAAQDVAQSLAVAGYCLGKLAYAAADYEGMADLLETHADVAQAMMQEHIDQPSALPLLYEQVKDNISTENVARVGTKAVVDMMLLHGVTKVVSAIAKESVATFIGCMRKGEQSADVALTAENISVQCGEEIASVMQKMESTQKTGGSAAAAHQDIVQKIRNVGDDILDVMEKAGGHTLKEHVSKTHSKLISRISTIKTKTVTSFTNKHVAINAVKENLKYNAEKIASWLVTNPPHNAKKSFDFLHPYHIGNGIIKGKRNGLQSLNESRIVLTPCLTNEFGFEIITSFPIIKH